MLQKWIIDSSLLKVDDENELGRGGFAVVYKGKWGTTDVAIRQLLISNFSPIAQPTSELAMRISPMVARRT